MENIKIAQVCGLCAGCKNAINLAINAKKENNVTIFKEIVHNKNINNSLKNLGINCVHDLNELNKNDTIIIRAHGEPPQTYNFFEDNDISFLDGTCPNVKSIHNQVALHSENGFIIVIIGKYGKHNGLIHPEVYGTMGYSKQTPILIEDVDDAKKIESIFNSKLFIVCQTTFNPNKFEEIQNIIVDICKKNNNELIIKNTICGAQKAIQKSTLDLATHCDLMIIVGGKNSSNTIELFNNSKQIVNAIHIENINDWLDEINKIKFKITKTTIIGLSAGASTDKKELDELKLILTNYINSL